MTTRRVLAVAALSSAVLAVLAGDPRPGDGAGAVGTSDPPDGAAAYSRIDAITLAERIRTRDPYLLVIDARDSSAFADFAIPTAVHLAPDRPARLIAEPGATVVVYADDDAAADRAAAALRSAGHGVVRVLDGGVRAWIDRVLEPKLFVDATAADSQVFSRAAAVGRYFGGVPRAGVERTVVADSTATAGTDDAGVRPPVRRRGCGHD